MPYKDPVKQKEAQHQHYLDNKGTYIEAAKQSARRRSLWLQELKSSMCCTKCGETRFPCLDFHHPEVIGNNKEKKISYICKRWGKKRVLEEIKKCVVLCANCHRMEHWDEENGNYFKLHNGTVGQQVESADLKSVK